jgi:hypothetical protein
LYTARGLPDAAAAAVASPGMHHEHSGDASRRVASAEADAVEQLMRYVEGALARTRIHQFSAMPELRAPPDTAPVPTWVVEIPLLHRHGVDGLQLRIEEQRRTARDSAAPERLWQVLMCLDSEALGPLHALVQLAGRRLSATLWAERAATLHAARAALDELDGALRAQGVEVERLECMPGRPASTVATRFERLLDVRT